jgi:hypothetical protein
MSKIKMLMIKLADFLLAVRFSIEVNRNDGNKAGFKRCSAHRSVE